MASSRPRIGQIFLAKKLITQLELNTALQHQERFGERIGSILTKLNYVTESDLVQILSDACHPRGIGAIDPIKAAAFPAGAVLT